MPSARKPRSKSEKKTFLALTETPVQSHAATNANEKIMKYDLLAPLAAWRFVLHR